MNELARKKLNRQRIFKIILTPFLIALFGGLLYRAVLYYWQQDYGTLTAVLSHLDGEAITFSEPDGVFDSSVDLSLQMHSDLPEDARIFYTLDGTDPVTEGSDGSPELSEDAGVERYFAPIHLTPGTQPVTMVTVKACVQWKDESSPVQTHYYLITRDHDIYTVMQDLYTVAITAPDEALYDYDTGILADGVFHDQAVKLFEESPDKASNPDRIGNWSQDGPEWVRAAHCACFSPDGKLLLEQPAGLSVTGNSSRRRDPISLELKAGVIYEKAWLSGITGVIPSSFNTSADEQEMDEAPDSFFITDIFNDSLESDLSNVKKYKKLRLRSMNQPLRGIQTAFLYQIARECGFPGISPDLCTIVLLNDEIHSLSDLQPNYTDGWIKRRFSLPSDTTIEKYKGSDELILEEMGVLDLIKSDLNDKKNQTALESAVDMDDLLLYYAIEILADNRDWPWPVNNCEAWRCASDSIIPDNPYADGRVRFLLFDVDNIYTGDRYSFMDTEILTSLMDKQDGVFASLMKCDSYRKKFLTIVCDLCDSSFQTEHLLNTYDALYKQYRHSLVALELSNDQELASLEETYNWRRDAIADRESILRSIIKKRLLNGDDRLLSYQIESPQGATLQWGTRSLTGKGVAEGRYYSDCSITISATPSPGYVWEHWIVNGQIVTENDPILSEDGLQLNLDGFMGWSEKPLRIQAVVHPFEGPSLVISEVSSKDGRDWITLYNAGTAPVSLGDYQLFNTRTQAYNDLSSKKLAPGREIRLGSKQSILTQVGGGLVTFRIRQGDGIYLLLRNSAETEEQAEEPSGEIDFPHSTVIDHVIVPRMCDGEVYCRCRDASGAVTAFHCFQIDPSTQ